MDISVKTIRKLRFVNEDSWLATLASLLPLWLWSLATTLEGFPRHPISLEIVAIASFWLAIPVSILLLWKSWLTFDILLVSLTPFILPYLLDEISTPNNTPFTLLSALVLSIGMVLAQRSGSLTVRWLILLFVTVAVLVLSSNAAQNYWQMAGELGYVNCFPDAFGCPPIPADATPWWVLFFSPCEAVADINGRNVPS